MISFGDDKIKKQVEIGEIEIHINQNPTGFSVRVRDAVTKWNYITLIRRDLPRNNQIANYLSNK